MNSAWNKFRRIISIPLWHKNSVGPADEVQQALATEKRLNILIGQLAQVERQINELMADIGKKFESAGSSEYCDFTKHLMRSRDLRFKAYLLQAELNRSFPDFAGHPNRSHDKELSKETQARIRKEAQKILSKQAFENQTHKYAFQRAIDDILGSVSAVRCQAVNVLQNLGDPSLSSLLSVVLTIDDDALQVECLQALEKTCGSQALDIFEFFVGSCNPAVRVTALRALNKFESPLCTGVCLQCLADKDTNVRKTATTILGWRQIRQAVAMLGVLLKDENCDVRLAAVEAIAVMNSERTVFALFRAMNDDSSSVRSAAKRALSKILNVEIPLEVENISAYHATNVNAWLEWWSRARVDRQVHTFYCTDDQQIDIEEKTSI